MHFELGPHSHPAAAAAALEDGMKLDRLFSHMEDLQLQAASLQGTPPTPHGQRMHFELGPHSHPAAAAAALEDGMKLDRLFSHMEDLQLHTASLQGTPPTPHGQRMHFELGPHSQPEAAAGGLGPDRLFSHFDGSQPHLDVLQSSSSLLHGQRMHLEPGPHPQPESFFGGIEAGRHTVTCQTCQMVG
eukprot:tig00000139_g8306.t1